MTAFEKQLVEQGESSRNVEPKIRRRRAFSYQLPSGLSKAPVHRRDSRLCLVSETQIGRGEAISTFNGLYGCRREGSLRWQKSGLFR